MVRIKNRYLLAQINFSDNQILTSLDSVSLLRSIRASVKENFGDEGAGKVSASLQVKYLNPWTGLAIIRVTRDHFRIAWACLSMLTRLDKFDCGITVLHISGTIKKCQKRAIEINKQEILGQTRVLGEKKTIELLETSQKTISAIEA